MKTRNWGIEMLQEDKIPKIFISYSWGSSELVLELAQRLVAHGVDVVLDKWDLKEGQDKETALCRLCICHN